MILAKRAGVKCWDSVPKYVDDLKILIRVC